MFDDLANDLSVWIDQTASEVALAFAPARSPFSAKITEQQKLDFYKTRLFNPDGSPNIPGRNEEIQRLGAEGFAHVYKAVVAAFPELKPPEQMPIQVPEQWPAPPGPGAAPPPLGGPPAPPLPPGPAAPPPMMPPPMLMPGGPS